MKVIQRTTPLYIDGARYTLKAQFGNVCLLHTNAEDCEYRYRVWHAKHWYSNNTAGNGTMTYAWGVADDYLWMESYQSYGFTSADILDMQKAYAAAGAYEL